MKAASSDFNRNVFINCPFDQDYAPLFNALVFTIYLLRFSVRCSREENNSGNVRLEKIVRLIKESKFGIHDLSRTEQDTHHLPRFNMPFELGVDLGLSYSGQMKFKKKVHLILDKSAYRYQHFLSDISGQDISAHRNSVIGVISAVRDWLRTATTANMPTAGIINQYYRRFLKELPDVCEDSNLDINEITFRDYSFIVSKWLKTNYETPGKS
jgi:hypothetical protein